MKRRNKKSRNEMTPEKIVLAAALIELLIKLLDILLWILDNS